jgi:ABC-type antimicrobial peptide transport system permease subunit
MGIEGWRRKALNRDQWRQIAQEAKAHVGLYCQVMMMSIKIVSTTKAVYDEILQYVVHSRSSIKF